MENNFIKKFWNDNALKYRTDHWASWGDIYAIQLEIDTISAYINDNQNVLDIGCGNGFSTIKQYELRERKIKISGIDFSENMIDFANKQKEKSNLNSDISFKIGDIKQIDFKDEYFDVAYTTRVLINLQTWEEQKIGINECLRVVKKGGKVVLCEAFYEPLVLLNSFRQLKNLEPLVEHDFNRYLKLSKLKQFLTDNKLKFEVIDFSSLYYLGSRFLRELVTKYEDYEGYSNPINEVFYNIEKDFSGGGFGIQQAIVITK